MRASGPVERVVGRRHTMVPGHNRRLSGARTLGLILEYLVNLVE
jgi:hypothetical protein